MAIETDTFVERIPIVPATDLGQRIIDVCELHSSRDKARRLAAAFSANDQVVLIFQKTPD
jgi:hypothetical protein